MIVSNLCVREVSACSMDTSLLRAGAIMRREDVGALPVLDRQDRVVGIITDRDIALELTRRGESAGDIYVDEVMCEQPTTCESGDDVRDVLRLMADNEVRRLPVVDSRGRLEGIISIDDLLCHAASDVDGHGLSPSDVIQTFCQITQHYQRTPQPASRSREPRGEGRRESPRLENEGNGRTRREKSARH